MKYNEYICEGGGICKNGLMNWDSENSSHTPLSKGKQIVKKNNLHSYFIQQNFTNATTSENIGSIFHLFSNYAWKKLVTKRRSQNAHNKQNVSIKLCKLRLENSQ